MERIHNVKSLNSSWPVLSVCCDCKWGSWDVDSGLSPLPLYLKIIIELELNFSFSWTEDLISFDKVQSSWLQNVGWHWPRACGKSVRRWRVQGGLSGNGCYRILWWSQGRKGPPPCPCSRWTPASPLQAHAVAGWLNAISKSRLGCWGTKVAVNDPEQPRRRGPLRGSPARRLLCINGPRSEARVQRCWPASQLPWVTSSEWALLLLQKEISRTLDTPIFNDKYKNILQSQKWVTFEVFAIVWLYSVPLWV